MTTIDMNEAWERGVAAGRKQARECAQAERDAELLRKHAEKYASTVLVNLPADYVSRKRIITNAILAALQTATPTERTNMNMLRTLEAMDAFWGSDSENGEPVCPAAIYPGAYLTDEDRPIRDVVREVVRKAKGEL